MNKNDSDYISHTIQYAIKNRVSINLSRECTIRDGDSPLPFGGYFCPNDRSLVVATGCPFREWFPTFVHESCHMDQFLEDSQYWKITNLQGGGCALVNLFDWIIGKKKLTETQAKLYAYRCGQLELDCERRVIEKIDKFGLSIDRNHHIQQSNAYILFYNFVAKHRIWTKPNRSAYKYKEIVNKMSTSFDYDYTRLPVWFEKDVIKYCFDGKIEPIPMEL